MSQEEQAREIEQGNQPEPVMVRSAQPPKEHLLGTILLVLIIFFILSSLAGIVFVLYSQWKHAADNKARPTIQTLDTAAVTEPKEEPAPAPAPAEEKKEEPKTTGVDLSKEKITVLNGGAATGSAGKLATALKADKIDASTGSTQGDFTGTVIYYATGKEDAAKALLPFVQKTFADATTKPQDATKKETATADITVILGATN